MMGDSGKSCVDRVTRVEAQLTSLYLVYYFPSRSSHAKCIFLYCNIVYIQYQDKKLRLSLNGNRKVVGTLRGYDAFLNVVLEDAVDEKSDGGNVGTVVIRGNSIIQFETLQRTAT